MIKTETHALIGPPDGTWRLVDGGPYGGPHYCGVCKTFHQTAWCYFVGTVALLIVCEECAEKATSSD